MGPGTAESPEKIGGGYDSAAAPVWTPAGRLLFSDLTRRTIYQWSPGDDFSCYRDDLASSGMTVDHQGRLIVCDPIGQRVVRMEPDGRITALADYFEGRRLNGPCDVVCGADGSLYFTDRPFRSDENEGGELPFNGIYRLVENRRLQLLVATLTEPCGLAFSPDEQFLYVSNSDPAHMLWMRYQLDSERLLPTGDVLCECPGGGDEGVPGALQTDLVGNLLAIAAGGIWVLSRSGDLIKTIRLPEQPTGLQWGGDGTDLYITTAASIYRMRWSIGGKLP